MVVFIQFAAEDAAAVGLGFNGITGMALGLPGGAFFVISLILSLWSWLSLIFGRRMEFATLISR